MLVHFDCLAVIDGIGIFSLKERLNDFGYRTLMPCCYNALAKEAMSISLSISLIGSPFGICSMLFQFVLAVL